MYVPGVVGVPEMRLPLSVSPSGSPAAWNVIGATPLAEIVYAKEMFSIAETVCGLVITGDGSVGVGPNRENDDVLPLASVMVAVRFSATSALVSIFHWPLVLSLRP